METPFNLTELTPLKFDPNTVITSPEIAEDGLKEEMTGGRFTVTAIVLLVAVQPLSPATATEKFPEFVTVIEDVVAPLDQV